MYHLAASIAQAVARILMHFSRLAIDLYRNSGHIAERDRDMKLYMMFHKSRDRRKKMLKARPKLSFIQSIHHYFQYA